MSIYERYRRTRVPALSGLEQVRARLEAVARRRVAQTAQQVAAGQLLLHDPEVRLAMGPEQEAQAYERLNDLEASIGLPPTPYTDVPKQEFAKQIHAGQVKVAERALPAGEREMLLDNLADVTIARFGSGRVARYLVDLRNQQTLAQAAMRQAQGEPEAEATEPPMAARQWVRSLIEPHAPPAGSGLAVSAPPRPAGAAAGAAAGARAGEQAGRRPTVRATGRPLMPAATPARRPEPPPVPSLNDYGKAGEFSPARQQWAIDEVDRDPSLIMDFGRFRERYRKKYGDNALRNTPGSNLRDLWRYASDTTRAWLQRVWNGPRLRDPNKRYQVQQLRRDHPDWTREGRGAEATRRGWSPEAFDAAWFGYGAKTGPRPTAVTTAGAVVSDLPEDLYQGAATAGLGVARTGVGLAKTAVEVGTLGQVRPDWEVTAPPGLDFPEYAAFSEAGTIPLTFIGGAGAERAAVGTLGLLGRAVGVTERAAPILERAAQVTGALNRSRAGQWLLRGLEVVRPRGVGISAVAAEQTERYTPLVMESLEPWRRAVDGWLDPQKYPLANKFLREFPQELALVPGGVFGFKATLLEAASRGDTKAMGQLAESMARPFYSPVQSFKENPAGTVLMWAMVGGTYAERLRAQVKATHEVERRALEAFGDMMAEQRAAVRQGLGQLAEGSRVYVGWLEDYPELAKEFPAEAELYREAIAWHEKARGQREALDGVGRGLESRYGAQWVGDTKSVESTVEKVARERRRDPQYGLRDVNDHVRGSIIAPDWETYAAVVEDLHARGYRIRQWLDRPMPSGYMGTHATFSMGDGINAEIQVHIGASSEISRAQHGSYEEDRKWRYVPREEIPADVWDRLWAGRLTTGEKYSDVYRAMPEPIRRRIAALAKASAQRERGTRRSP